MLYGPVYCIVKFITVQYSPFSLESGTTKFPFENMMIPMEILPPSILCEVKTKHFSLCSLHNLPILCVHCITLSVNPHLKIHIVCSLYNLSPSFISCPHLEFCLIGILPVSPCHHAYHLHGFIYATLNTRTHAATCDHVILVHRYPILYSS